MLTLVVINVLMAVLAGLLFYDRAQTVYDRLAVEDYLCHPQRVV